MNSRSRADARQSLRAVTKTGKDAFAPPQQSSQQEASALLTPLAGGERQQLLEAMVRVPDLPDPDCPQYQAAQAVLRDWQPGDMDWVVQQHGEVYASEYG